MLCLGITINLLSIAAPGYYSHEELSNGIFFSQHPPHWNHYNPLDFSRFHYRPIPNFLGSFILSRFFDVPPLVHLYTVLLSVFNGVLFYHLVLRISGQARAALFGFAAFNLFPASIFVSGWVAAWAELFWMMAALGIAHILLLDRNAASHFPSRGEWKPTRPEAWRQAGIALLFVLGLMSKETALVMPAAITGLCLLVKPWRGWFWAVFISGCIAALYLLLRWEGLFHVSRIEVYDQSLHNAIWHAMAYWLYPWSAGIVLDLHVRAKAFLELLFSRSGVLWLSIIASALPVLLLLLRRRWRWAIAYVFYAYVFLAPVLAIYSDLHFLYGMALPVAAAFAYAFRQGESRWVTAVALALFALLAIGGLRISFHFHETAVIQSRIHDRIISIARAHDRLKGHDQTNFSVIYENYAANQPMSVLLFRAIGFYPHVGGYEGRAEIAKYRHRIFNHQALWEREKTPPDAIKLFFTDDGDIVER